MHYGNIKNNDIANGDGIRVSLFVSGCNRHCKNCFNSETWDFMYGSPFTDNTIKEIIKLLEPNYISGLTILGGEPMEKENQKEVLNLINIVRQKYGKTKNIWLYSGFTLEELLANKNLDTINILKNIDILVDGPFIENLKDISLKFRGSKNQRIIDTKTIKF